MGAASPRAYAAFICAIADSGKKAPKELFFATSSCRSSSRRFVSAVRLDRVGVDASASETAGTKPSRATSRRSPRAASSPRGGDPLGGGSMVARARRPHASSRVATRARWDTPPLYDDDAFLFWETPRARALRESGVCRAFHPASRDPSIGYSASGARAGGDRKGTPSLPKPVARARVRDVHPDGCLPSDSQSAKAFRFFSREIGARRAGRSVRFSTFFTGRPKRG